MNFVRNIIMKYLYCYGQWGAKRISFHGTYEPHVPKCLNSRH